MSKKLHYFPINGLGESIRYILHYAGEKFEDIRYEKSEWPAQKAKDFLPFGLLPYYEEGNKGLDQSIAIARYLASQTDLLPSDPWEQALLDAIVLNVYDFWGKVLLTYQREPDPEKKAASKKTILTEVIPFYFSRFEKKLIAGNGHFAGKLSWADFILVGFIETSNLFLGGNIETNYPTVVDLVKKIQTLPGVKEYIEKRKPYVI